MGVAEWNGLPWWEQRLLLDGLMDEFQDREGGAEQQTNSGSVVFDGKPGELGALGYRERNL